MREGTSSHPATSNPDVPRYSWYVVGLLTIINLINYADRMALAVLAPSIKGDLNLSDGEIGLLAGFAFAAFYAICGIPLARLADRGNRKSIIAVSVAVWSIMTALSGAALSFTGLLLARIGVGAAEAGGYTPAQSIICDYIPIHRRAFAFAVHSSGLVAGTMTGLILAGFLGQHIGWRWTFVVFGIPGILAALILQATLREPVRGILDKPASDIDHRSVREALRQLWNCRTYRYVTLLVIANGFVQYGFIQWWPSFYVRVHGLSLTTVGSLLGLALGLGAIVGTLIGGFAANRLTSRGPHLPLLLGACTTLIAFPVVTASLFVSSPILSISLVAVASILWSLSNGPAVAAMVTVLHPRTRAMGSAVSIMLGAILGFGLGPVCVGYLSDLLSASYQGESLRYALLCPAMIVPVMASALLLAARSLPSDLHGSSSSRTPDSAKSSAAA